ncbi:MAG: DUF2794 domain-containing protein [Inquilinus sp.]|nr:DUF2794 domain-containing protein [Inquilinus sp.]
MADIVRLSDYRHRKGQVFFDRCELAQLLAVYSDRVSRGEWRDYAVDHAAGVAMFSVFRHSQDRPLYAISKMQNQRGTEYAVFDGCHRLVHAPSLSDVLSVFTERPRPVD